MPNREPNIVTKKISDAKNFYKKIPTKKFWSQDCLEKKIHTYLLIRVRGLPSSGLPTGPTAIAILFRDETESRSTRDKSRRFRTPEEPEPHKTNHTPRLTRIHRSNGWPECPRDRRKNSWRQKLSKKNSWSHKMFTKKFLKLQNPHKKFLKQKKSGAVNCYKKKFLMLKNCNEKVSCGPKNPAKNSLSLKFLQKKFQMPKPLPKNLKS